MPNLGAPPRPMFLSRADMRQWSNTNVMTISGTDITLDPATSQWVGSDGVFETMLHFLHGLGSRAVATVQTIGALTTAAYTGGGTISWGIDSSDKWYVETSGGAATDFTITASTNLAALGAATSTYGLVGGATPFRRTFENDWVRGNAQKISITIDPAGAGAAFSVAARMLQNPITWLRSQNEGDAETSAVTNTTNLERTISVALALTQVRCGITTAGTDDGGTAIKAGRVFILLYGGAAAPTWNSTTFRDRLGFSGSEALRTVGGESVLIADYPCPGVWVPPFAPSRVTSWGDESTSTLDLRSGDLSANLISRKSGWRIETHALGEVSSDDHEWHHLRDFWRLAPKGHPLSLCFDSGDTRRQLYPAQVTSSQAGYTKLYTVQTRRGRIRCRRDSDDTTRRLFQYESDYYARAAVEVALRNRVD